MRFNAMVLALAYLLFGGQGVLANDAVGVWFTEDGEAKVRLSECGDTLCSEIVWVKQTSGPDGGPLRDTYNPDPSKRDRKIIGLEILQNLKPDGRNQWSGQIYNPENGKTYKAQLTLTSPNQIVLKGCTQWGWPCGQKTWRRAEPREQQQEVARNTPNRPDPRQRGNAPAQQQAEPQQQAAPQQQENTQSQQQEKARSQQQEKARSQQSRQDDAPTSGSRQSAPRQQPEPQDRSRSTQQNQTAALPSQSIPQQGGDYLVQVAARQDHREALRAFGQLQQQFPQFLRGLKPRIQKVDLGARGIWYRVAVGPLAQRGAAMNFCRQLKAAGGDCLVRQR